MADHNQLNENQDPEQQITLINKLASFGRNALRQIHEHTGRPVAFAAAGGLALTGAIDAGKPNLARAHSRDIVAAFQDDYVISSTQPSVFGIHDQLKPANWVKEVTGYYTGVFGNTMSFGIDPQSSVLKTDRLMLSGPCVAKGFGVLPMAKEVNVEPDAEYVSGCPKGAKSARHSKNSFASYPNWSPALVYMGNVVAKAALKNHRPSASKGETFVHGVGTSLAANQTRGIMDYSRTSTQSGQRAIKSITTNNHDQVRYTFYRNAS